MALDWPQEERDRLRATLTAAYSRISTGDANYALHYAVVRDYAARIMDEYHLRGYSAPPIVEDVLRRRLTQPPFDEDPARHVDLVCALVTDYYARFASNWAYREMAGANVQMQCAGYTGSGKSSGMVELLLANRDGSARGPVRPADLDQFLVFRSEEIPAAAERCQPGDTIICDEELRGTGAGSKTARDNSVNLENTLRGTGINLVWVSPQVGEHAVSQLVLEAVLVNLEAHRTLFLVEAGGYYLGAMDLPWCRSSHWPYYSAFKRRNLAATMAGEFRARSDLSKVAMGLFGKPGFVRLLSGGKPKKRDVDLGVNIFGDPAWPIRKVEQVQGIIWTMLQSHKALGKEGFVEAFEVLPVGSFESVAEALYAE